MRRDALASASTTKDLGDENAFGGLVGSSLPVGGREGWEVGCQRWDSEIGFGTPQTRRLIKQALPALLRTLVSWPPGC